MKDFNYLAPESLAEALDQLARLDGQTRVMAGGTDLIVEMRSRKKVDTVPAHIIDLKKIPGLEYITDVTGKGLRLGSLARVRDIETSEDVRGRFPILSAAAGTLGSMQVRHRATVGGNLCHASPSADLAPPLIALGAAVNAYGPGGEKSLALEDFFVGPGETVLQRNELLTEIFVPEMAANTQGVYLKFSPRRAMDLAVAGVAAVLTTDPGGRKCEEVRIALGAVAPTPIRARKAEEILRGHELSARLLAEAAKTASGEARPITDVRGSDWYRRHVIGVLTVRALEQAWEGIGIEKGAAR